MTDLYTSFLGAVSATVADVWSAELATVFRAIPASCANVWATRITVISTPVNRLHN